MARRNLGRHLRLKIGQMFLPKEMSHWFQQDGRFSDGPWGLGGGEWRMWWTCYDSGMVR